MHSKPTIEYVRFEPEPEPDNPVDWLTGHKTYRVVAWVNDYRGWYPVVIDDHGEHCHLLDNDWAPPKVDPKGIFA